MRKISHRAVTVILLALFMIYLIVLSKITVFRDSSSETQGANIIPFITIAEYFRFLIYGNKIIGISNLLGNLLLFLPLGYMSALLLPKMRKLTRILVLAFTFSLVIEVSQYILVCGRADIDDIILNTLGGAAGYWVYAFFSKFSKQKKYAIFISSCMIAVNCIGFFGVYNHRFLVRRPAPGGLPPRAERSSQDLSEPFIIDEQPNLSANAVTDTISDGEATGIQPNDSVEAAWYLILVNKWNYIPDDYKAELTELENGQSVDERICPALKEMLDAARNDGIYPVVISGYRTAEQQQRLLDGKIAEYKAESGSDEEAVSKAEAWVAIPGTSEHQLGLAVDINADGINSTGYEVYEWLIQNSYRFGFIQRYPAGKTEITGVINEPWHYRYVGVQAASEIYHQKLCLEEYLGKLNGVMASGGDITEKYDIKQNNSRPKRSAVILLIPYAQISCGETLRFAVVT